MQYWLGID